MVTKDKSPTYLFNDLPNEQKYKFGIMKSLETFEIAVALATNKRDDEALVMIQEHVRKILQQASESIADGTDYTKVEW